MKGVAVQGRRGQVSLVLGEANVIEKRKEEIRSYERNDVSAQLHLE